MNMMNNKGKICPFFLKGNCKYGTNCKNIHPNGQMSMQMNQQKMTTDNEMNDGMNFNSPPPTFVGNVKQNQSKICVFFLKGNCTNQNCSYFHGYGNNLQHISTTQAQQKAILGIVAINDIKFVTYDENSFKIWVMSPNFSCFQENQVEGKITRLIYSKGKIIYASQIESMLSSKSLLSVFTDSNNFKSQSELEKINDLIEVENYVICVGKGMIDVFQISDAGINKGTSIPLNNDEISSIILVQQLFLCGHQNGVLSIWKPGQNPFLQCDKSTKAHDDTITKIYLKVVNEFTHFVITCSKDKFIKVFNLENNLSIVFVKQFKSIVSDINNVADFEGKDCFIITLSDGNILCTNDNFEELYEIRSRFNYIGPRISLSAVNPYKNETLGNFLLLSDSYNLDVYMWIKEGSFAPQKKQNNHPHPHPHYNNNSNFSYRGGRGGHFRGRGF